MQNLRAFQWEDLDNIIALIQACEAEDQNGSVPTTENFRHSLSIPGFEVTQFVSVLAAEDGRLIAICVGVPIPGPEMVTFQMDVTVHPDHRHGTLADDLLHQVEAQAQAWCERENRSANLHASAKAHQTHRLQLYERNGYRPARWFLQLERDLTMPIPESPIPDGLTIQPLDLSVDARTIHFVLTDAFQDHWNPVDLTPEQVLHLVKGPQFRPELHLIAFAAEGEPAGICFCTNREDYNRQNDTREGLVETVGVRRPFRRRGLARALLTRGLLALRDAGMTTAVLDVDSDNPTGATRLYSGVGFTERRRTVVLQKAITP